MTRAELELALQQQQAENAALRAQLAGALSVDHLPAATVFPNQDQFVLLMQELYTGVLLTDASGRVTWVSEGFTRLCGLELHEVLEQWPVWFLRPCLADLNTLTRIRASLQAQTPFEYEMRNPRIPAGTADWIRVKAQPIYNEQREVVMIAGLLEDITEWKKIQSNLIENEQRFRALAENVPGVLYEWRLNADGSFKFQYVSPKLYELFGIVAEEIIRMSDYIHPDDAHAFAQSMKDATQTRSPWSYEGRIVVAGQPVRWMRGSAVVTSSDKTGMVYSGILVDITPLRMAQTALRESDLRWRLAVEGFGDGTWERNFTTNEISYSTAYKSILGYRNEEFPDVATTWRTHVHPDDQASALQAFDNYLSGKTPLYVSEHRLRRKDGSYTWVLSRGIITERDAQGEPVIFTGSNTDISALKEVRNDLEISSRRLSTVIANFQEGLVLEDENRKIVLTNEAFCSLLDMPVPPTRLVGRDGAWLTEGSKNYFEKPDQYLERIKSILHEKKPVIGDVLALCDGRIIQRDFSPIHDQDRYIGHLWKYEDITARTKVQEDLKRREEKYRSIIENMSLGLVEADLDDHLIYANQSFCDMTGFRRQELEGHQVAPLMVSGQDLELVESKAQIREQGISDSYEITITTKTGEKKWVLVSGAPLYDDRHQLIGSIGIYLDVTPQKHLEASLREAKALAEISTHAKQDFLANMSHEIRTPMNAILGMSQLLAKTTLTPTQTSYLHAISDSADNLLVIINDILDLSKIEAGRMIIEKIGFSAAGVCTQVAKTLQYKAEEKGLTFVTHLDPGLPAVLLGDPYRITQILLNLIGNSVKFTEKGTVSLACALVEHPTADEAVIEFTVQDTGIGINAEYLAQVFDDFSQEDSSVTRKFGGSGLGLGISKSLVELLGGELRIESQKHAGTTSRFALRLPVGSPQDVPQKDTANVSGLQHALRGKRILLVEDNMFNRMLANIFLSNAEMEVTEAENGEIAVDLAQKQEFDLILMDVQMPVMNGYEATALIRQQAERPIPIIALTANAIKGERNKCLAAGMNDYLTKPFQEASLTKMVYDWLVGPLSTLQEQLVRVTS